MKNILELRARVERLRREAVAAEEQLAEHERRCKHKFGEAVYAPIRTEGFHDTGDPPGTMGVDRRLPSYFPPTTTDRWKRTCELCGKVEYTTKKQPKEYVPDFGGGR